MCVRSDKEGLLREGERLDDLQRKGLMIIQHPAKFRFGTDAVLLAHHSGLRKNERVCDLGTGTGVLCLLLSALRQGTRFDAVEIMEDVADMARRSVLYNGLEERIAVHGMDMRQAPEALGPGLHHLVVCNPPYYKLAEGLVNQSESKGAARHETHIRLDEIAAVAGALLMNHGRMAMIIPATRCAEAMAAMQAANIEPKYARMVQARPERPPKLMILRGMKGGNPGVHWAAPLITHEVSGAFSAEMLHIYGE